MMTNSSVGNTIQNQNPNSSTPSIFRLVGTEESNGTLNESLRNCALKTVNIIRQLSQAVSVCEARFTIFRLLHNLLDQKHTYLRIDQIATLNHHSAQTSFSPLSFDQLLLQIFKTSPTADVKLLFDWVFHSLDVNALSLFCFRVCFVSALLRYYFVSKHVSLNSVILEYLKQFLSSLSLDPHDHPLKEINFRTCSSCRFWWAIGTLLGELARHHLLTPQAYMRYLISRKLLINPNHQYALLHFPFPLHSSLADFTERKTLLRRTPFSPLDLRPRLKDIDLPSLLNWCRTDGHRFSRHTAGEVIRHIILETHRFLTNASATVPLFRPYRTQATPSSASPLPNPAIFDLAFIFFQFFDLSSLLEYLHFVMTHLELARVPYLCLALLSLVRSYWNLNSTSPFPSLPSNAEFALVYSSEFAENSTVVPQLTLNLLTETKSTVGIRQMLLSSSTEEDPVGPTLIAMLISGNHPNSCFELRKLFALFFDEEQGHLIPSHTIPVEKFLILFRQFFLSPLAEPYSHFDNMLVIARGSLCPKTHLWPFLIGCCAHPSDDVWSLALELAISSPYHAQLLSLSPQDLQSFITSEPFKLHGSRQKILLHCLRTRQLLPDPQHTLLSSRFHLHATRHIIRSLNEWTFSLDSIEAKVLMGQDLNALIQAALCSLCSSKGASSEAIAVLSTYLIQMEARMPQRIIEEVLRMLKQDPQFDKPLSSLLNPSGTDDEDNPDLHGSFLSLFLSCLQAIPADSDFKRNIARTLVDQLNQVIKLYATTPFLSRLDESTKPDEFLVSPCKPLLIQRNILLRVKLLASLMHEIRKEPDELRALSLTLLKLLSIPIIHLHSLYSYPPQFLASWILGLLYNLLDDLFRDASKQHPRFPSRFRPELTNEFMKIISENPAHLSISALINIFLPHLVRSATKVPDYPIRSQSTIDVLAPHYVAQHPRRRLTYSSFTSPQ